jgi:hypothetical protein
MRQRVGAFEWISCVDWGSGFPVTILIKIGLN